MTATGLEVFVSTMTTFISDSYYALEETLIHRESIKLKSYRGENTTYFWSEILVDAERLEGVGAFNPDNLGCITHIFENTSDSIFNLWEINKYKEVMYLSKNFVWWEPATGKEKSQDQTSIPKA